MDLSAIYADSTEVRGAPPFDPRLMLKIVIYGYSHGVTSSRALERRCNDDVAFGLLTAQQSPDLVAINRLRSRHATAFAELFTQSLAFCGRAGLVSLGRVALDGTKVRASASRHRAMSDDRMVRAEAELAAEVAALLADSERLGAAEDAAYGPGRCGDQLPAELAQREERLAAIRAARAAVEAEHAAKARAVAEQTATEQEQDPTQITQAGDAAEASVMVPANAQQSFTDPDARIVKTCPLRPNKQPAHGADTWVHSLRVTPTCPVGRHRISMSSCLDSGSPPKTTPRNSKASKPAGVSPTSKSEMRNPSARVDRAVASARRGRR